MLDFGNHIKELLLLHDCVILPGLGGFVANYKPAEFNATRNTATPPSKQILFNRNLIHNDGLLYAQVSALTEYGYKDVQEMAHAYVERIRRETGKGMKFVLDGLGYFFLDGENQIRFEEEAGNNFLLESYGLPFLQYREVEKFAKTEHFRLNAIEPDVLQRQRKIRRWVYSSAAACIVAAMILVPIRNGYFDQAGIDIPIADSFQKKQIEQTGNNNASGTLVLSASSLNNILMPDPEYDIVVGSFKDFGNARLLRNQLVDKGYEARILGTEKGVFRVSAGTYSAEVEAANNLASVCIEYKTAWIISN